jgi:hypothetical protein
LFQTQNYLKYYIKLSSDHVAPYVYINTSKSRIQNLLVPGISDKEWFKHPEEDSFLNSTPVVSSHS